MPRKTSLSNWPLFYYTLAVIFRLIPHPANFTPVGASSIYGGYRLSRPWNYLAPLLVMTLSDLFLGAHRTMIYVYLSILLAVWLGERLSTRARPVHVALVALGSSVAFFLITNFGVWKATGLYSHTWGGLINCYVMALPFWRNALAGDLIFTGSFFLLPETARWASRLAKRKFAVIMFTERSR